LLPTTSNAPRDIAAIEAIDGGLQLIGAAVELFIRLDRGEIVLHRCQWRITDKLTLLLAPCPAADTRPHFQAIARETSVRGRADRGAPG
jgi:hypothetical protein